MVPVNKKIIAAKAPEAAEPQKRRPRNTELNSSKKPLTGKISTAGRNPFARKLNCSKLVGSTFDGKTYDEARKLLMADELGYEQLWDYFGEYMPKIGAEIGKNVDMQYGETADVFFNTMAECATEAEFVKEVQDKLKEYRDLCVEDVNSSTDRSMNCSDGDKGSEVGTVTIYNDFADLNVDEVETLIKDRVKEMSPNCDVSVEKLNDTELKISLDGTDEDITRGRLAVESSDVTKSVDWESSLDSGCHGEKMNSSEDSDEVNPSEKDVASINCSEDEYATIYTESGNEVAITDIKIVQNPQTNALALFVPENGDDEIPEGFTVIGDVIATASGAPAIEENAETGDGSLNSSKKPPMNRAQRRAAQRGARRPKKR